VLDRALSFGTNPPLYSEIINSMSGRNTRHDFRVASYVYGLGGRNIFQKQIESVFSDLINGDQNNKIKFII
jgi:pyruvate/2-oxoacid:ferredoxin oxidoreductase alpha subunit